jgi:hypothetical protein
LKWNFRGGRKRNWECPERDDSAKEVREDEIKREINERLELWRKRELVERERKTREKEEFERKKRLEETEQKKFTAQGLEVKKKTTELQGEKSIESAWVKELGIK